MKVRTIKISHGVRWYEREDGTYWELRKDDDYRIWYIWQIDPETDEIVYDDPRNGISDSEPYEPKISMALDRIRKNF